MHKQTVIVLFAICLANTLAAQSKLSLNDYG